MDDRAMTLLAGAGLGAGLMYFLDPQMGRRRRALVRDKVVGLVAEACEDWDALKRDLANRATGLAATARSRLTGDGADDRVVRDRVRSRLGRVVSHPRAIDVRVQDGRVTLSGPVLADEPDRVLACARAVPGVRDVEDRLDRHQTADIPALQGGRSRPGPRWELFQEQWSLTTRLLVGLAGGGLFAWGLTQRFPTACIAGSVGLGLLACSVTEKGISDLVPGLPAALGRAGRGTAEAPRARAPEA